MKQLFVGNCCSAAKQRIPLLSWHGVGDDRLREGVLGGIVVSAQRATEAGDFRAPRERTFRGAWSSIKYASSPYGYCAISYYKNSKERKSEIHVLSPGGRCFARLRLGAVAGLPKIGVKHLRSLL